MVETHGGRRFAYFVLAAAFLVLLLGRWIRPVDNAVMVIAAPFTAVVSGVANTTGDFAMGVFDGQQLRHDNQALRRQVNLLLEQNFQLRQAARQNKVLRRMLSFDQRNSHMDMVTANVIAEDAVGIDPYVIIDRGTSSGLREGMTVVDGSGAFVGSISQVATNYARVLLLTSPSSTVGAYDTRTQAVGVVDGWFDRLPQLDSVVATAGLKVGDFVATSGQLNLYPRNILIGQIREVHRTNYGLFPTVILQPAANLSHLEEVQVVRNYIPSVPARLLNQP